MRSVQVPGVVFEVGLGVERAARGERGERIRAEQLRHLHALPYIKATFLTFRVGIVYTDRVFWKVACVAEREAWHQDYIWAFACKATSRWVANQTPGLACMCRINSSRMNIRER